MDCQHWIACSTVMFSSSFTLDLIRHTQREERKKSGDKKRGKTRVFYHFNFGSARVRGWEFFCPPHTAIHRANHFMNSYLIFHPAISQYIFLNFNTCNRTTLLSRARHPIWKFWQTVAIKNDRRLKFIHFKITVAWSSVLKSK